MKHTIADQWTPRVTRTGVLAALQLSSTQHELCHLLGVGFGTYIIGQEFEVHTLEIVWVYELIWFNAAPARGMAGAPQLGFLRGQVQDPHSICNLGGLCQAQQHEVMAIVLFGELGMVLQETQVEFRVWEAITDLDKLGCVFMLEQVVATQPELVIPGERGGPRE